MLAANVLDKGWTETVTSVVGDSDRPLLVLAEGLFMYLDREEIGRLLHLLKEAFPHAMLVAEMNNPLMVKRQNHHDTVSKTNAVFKSGTWSAKELECLCEGILVVEEHSFNEEMKKYSFRGKLFAMLFPRMNDRWATFVW